MQSNRVRKRNSFLACLLAWVMVITGALTFGAGGISWAEPPRSLQGVPVPEPPDLANYVQDKAAAIRLGKALFWDMQVGSDGIQACASCHFQAGGDIRVKNQLDPGLLSGDITFQFGGANFTLAPGHFPTTTNDIVSSQGVFRRNFVDVVPGSDVDNCVSISDTDGFSVGGINVRRVPPRNTPSAVNAVFNFHNFWDGRADNIFNGATPRGAGAADTPIFQVIGGVPTQVTIAISNASLASQSTGPPRSDVEMSCAGRTWPDIGKKMLSLTPLAKQRVSPTDSVLGAIAAPDNGLTVSYSQLIQQAFVSSWWNSATPVTVGTKSFTMMEANFSLFWGLAIQLYEATLVSDQTPFDNGTLNAQQDRGLNIFNGKGGCSSSNCHTGFLFSSASEPDITKSFRDAGVRPTAEDLGAGPIFGDIDITRFNGTFKVSALRNVELNGPYFHHGGKATLMQVIEFYDDGGDFPNNENIDIGPRGLSPDEMADLEAFLLALTDERVRYEMAPFDHPQIFLPNGHTGDNVTITCVNPDNPIEACDDFLELPAVGAGGRLAAGLPPLRELLFQESPQYTLAVTISGAGTGAVTSLPAGIDCGASCSTVYDAGTAVTFTVTPGANSVFAGWSGDADCSDSQVTVNANKTCEAVFEPVTYALSLAKAGTGAGAVSTAPPGVSCGADCFQYDLGAVVTLTATPDAGSTFAGWSGDADCANGVVTMDADKACTATFDAQIVPPVFDDVPAGHWAHDFIETVYVAGVTAGCGANKFCPDDPVTRGQMAVFIETALGHPANAGTGRFTDVPANHSFAGFIELLAQDGITGGCGGGKFCPDAPVTRGQMAVFIEAALGHSPNAGTGRFTDVPADHPFAGYIEKMEDDGITGGCGGGEYLPDKPITRAEMAVFLVAAPPPFKP